MRCAVPQNPRKRTFLQVIRYMSKFLPYENLHIKHLKNAIAHLLFAGKSRCAAPRKRNPVYGTFNNVIRYMDELF